MSRSANIRLIVHHGSTRRRVDKSDHVLQASLNLDRHHYCDAHLERLQVLNDCTWIREPGAPYRRHIRVLYVVLF